MREQRNYMVQTAEQYTFIHYAILESITYGDTSYALNDFTSLYEKLREVNPASKKTLMDEEYSRLGQVKTMVKKSAFQKRLKRKGEPPRHFESSCEYTMMEIYARRVYIYPYTILREREREREREGGREGGRERDPYGFHCEYLQYFSTVSFDAPPTTQNHTYSPRNDAIN